MEPARAVRQRALQRYTAPRSARTMHNNNIGLGLALQRGPLAAQKIIDAATRVRRRTVFSYSSLPEMTALFNQQKLAFLVNAGTLVKPTDGRLRQPSCAVFALDQTHSGVRRRCPRAGWLGGLCSESFSLGANLAAARRSRSRSRLGSNRFEIGANSVPYQMSPNGLTALSGVCNPTCSGGAN